MLIAIMNTLTACIWAYLYFSQGDIGYAVLLCLYACLAGINIRGVIEDRNKILP
jgi:hypothetical protein